MEKTLKPCRFQALFLPEASDYIARNAEESRRLAQDSESSFFVRGLRDAARQYDMAINVGVHEPGADSKRVRNSLLWIDERGEIAQRYEKVHMFDLDLRDGPTLRESEYVHCSFPFSRSSALAYTHTYLHVYTVYAMLCYDARCYDVMPCYTLVALADT